MNRQTHRQNRRRKQKSKIANVKVVHVIIRAEPASKWRGFFGNGRTIGLVFTLNFFFSN